MSAVRKATELESIEVLTGSGPYQVLVGAGAASTLHDTLRQLPALERIAIVTDEHVPQSWSSLAAKESESAGIDSMLLTIGGGEESKTLDTVSGLLEAMAAGGMHRGDAVVAVGGGVVGDIAGFTAATFMRGVRLIQMPTTLLAMVDSSIGGKTGVNLAAGKNLAGAFHQPFAVLADTAALLSLPQREIRCGMSEIVKYGFIAAPRIIDLLEKHEPDEGLLDELIVTSIRCKVAAVEADEREEGSRAHLNFGHTLGHAIETVTGHAMSHGEAIAVGMVFALLLGRELGLVDLVERARAVLRSRDLPTEVEGISREVVTNVMERDKKFRKGIHFVVLRELGLPEVVANVPDAAVIKALEGVGIN